MGYIVPVGLGPLLIIFGAVIVGGGLGEVMSRIIGRKSSNVVAFVTLAALVLGALGQHAGRAVKLMNGLNLPFVEAMQQEMQRPWAVLFAVICGLVAMQRIRR